MTNVDATTITFDPGVLHRIMADLAIEACAEKAKRLDPAFPDMALSFLKVYAHKHDVFSSEDVTAAAHKQGITPHDLRAWGQVFRTAARQRYIERSPRTYKRRFGHGSPSQAWESLVYGV